MRSSLRIFSVCISAVLLLSAAGCSSRSTSGTGPASVKVAAADKHELKTDLDIAGVLAPVQTVNVAGKISGEVTSVNFDTGSTVKAGDPLITLETKTLNAQLQQAEAALSQADAASQAAAAQQSQAKINLDTALKAYDRIKALLASGAASQSQFDDAAARLELAQKQYDTAAGPAYNQAKAAVRTAQANINNIKVQMDYAVLTSPINGIVTNRNINTGEIASPGISLMTVADTSVLKLKGTVPQQALTALKEGQDIDVTVDIYHDHTFKGRIDSIGPVAVSTGEYFPIEISIQNSGELKAGLSAHAAAALKKDAVVVPVSAVVENNGQSYVFVIKDKTAVKRNVTTGFRNDSEVEISKGLEAGEQVAVSNVRVLFDNMPVEVN